MDETLEPRVLFVRPHPKLNLKRNPEEVQIGWIVDGDYQSFAFCKNNAEFIYVVSELRKEFGNFDVRDMRLTEPRLTQAPSKRGR